MNLIWPETTNVVLQNATVPRCLTDLTGESELVGCDIEIIGDHIAAVGADLSGDGATVNLSGKLIFPGFVDLHTHLDKGHIWPRAVNPSGTHLSAREAVKADLEAHWNAEDVYTRANFSLRCAYHHGTVALRTHLDSPAAQVNITWPVFERLRDEWAGRIMLQGVNIVPLETYGTAYAETIADVVAGAGGILGGSGALQPEAPSLVRRVFDLAIDRNLDIDLHVDETGDPDAHILRLVAQEAIRRNYQGRVTCGHCCSLAVQDPAYAAETIALVAAAGITVVSLPLVNLYLQGRKPGTPTWRGITLIHELRAAGVRVVVASDNTRDPFYMFGDLDMTEVFREAVRIGHLDLPIGDWVSVVNAVPAAVMKTTSAIRPGNKADLVVFSARSYSELLSRPQCDRLVIRSGKPIDAPLPSYEELDGLFARV